MPCSIIKQCSQMLADKGWTIAFAETATAGGICYEFSKTTFSNQILIGGIVAFGPTFKENILDSRDEVLQTHASESAEMTKSMALNLCSLSSSDICASVSGVANSIENLITDTLRGSFFVHIIFPHKVVAKEITFKGYKSDFIKFATIELAELIMEEIRIPEEV